MLQIKLFWEAKLTKGYKLPAISTGVYGYPVYEATVIAVKTVSDWIQKHDKYRIEVIFSCFDERTYRTYQEELIKAPSSNT